MGAGQYLLELTDDDTHKVYDILSETTAAIDKFQVRNLKSGDWKGYSVQMF